MVLSVFINLINNAVEAASYFQMCATVSDNAVLISIQNPSNGVMLEKDVFNLFFTTKQNGSGIGLNICNSLLEEVGAKLELKQSKENIQFDFKLPRAST